VWRKVDKFLLITVGVASVLLLGLLAWVVLFVLGGRIGK
jgi:hypothetical protein